MLRIVWFICVFVPAWSYDLRGIASGNRMGNVPLGRNMGDGVLDIEGVCSNPGLTCQDCKHAVTCVPLPNGWLKVLRSECGHDETCNARLGGCSKIPVPECREDSINFEHICEQVGIFPDAYDCKKFHLCSPPEKDVNGAPADHREAFCPRQYGYNPSNAQCSIKLKNDQCETTPVPECKVLGQTEVLPGSPNHYYICLTKQKQLFPQVFLCPNGWTFWGGFCRPDVQETEKNNENAVDTLNSGKSIDKDNEVNFNDNDNQITQEEVNKAKEVDETLKDHTTEINRYSLFNDFGYRSEETSPIPEDTFLADKFDLTGLVMDENFETSSYEMSSSETGFGVLD